MAAGHKRIFAMASICLLVGACTTTHETYRGAVAYNRAFDQARNEILLLNILRAREGYPQQYSTISQVVGSMRADAKASPSLANIISKAADAAFSLGTGVEFGLRNPAVTIAPLESKEFRAGMASPVSAELVNQLLAQGWDPALVEHLTAEEFEKLEPYEPDLGSRTVLRTLTVDTKEALAMLREGAGKHKLQVAKGVTDKPGSTTLEIVQLGGTCIRDFPTKSDCNRPGQRVRLRSPSAMILHLARSIDGDDPFFHVEQGSNPPPPAAIVATKFNRRYYYILGQPGGLPAGTQSRRTLETLSLLAEIIGFQTTDAALSASNPAVTIAQ